MKKLHILALSVSLALGACSEAPQSNSQGQAQVAKGEGQLALTSGINLAAMDTSVRPQDDFNAYVSGNWLQTTDIPGDKSRYGMFNVLYDNNEEVLKEIIQGAASDNPAAGSNEQKIGDMYASFMDQQRIQALGITPIADELARVQSVSNHTEMAALMGELNRLGVSAPLSLYVYPDAKNPGIYGMWLSQSGLTLPDRDYYFKQDDKFVQHRAAAKAYITDMLHAVGHDNAADAAERIMALETALAAKQSTRLESRDAEKNYNKHTSSQTEQVLSGFDWPAYARGAGVDQAEEMILRQMPYFTELGSIFASTPVATWKDYMTLRVASAFASSLHQELVDLQFNFYSKTLRGVPENRPRWKRGVSAVGGALGEVLGQQFVARKFTPEAKARMDQMVQNLIKAYGESIKELAWMSDATKTAALEKLSKFNPKIGYPDEWRDYSALEIKADDLVGNIKRSRAFEHEFDVARIGKEVSPVDWGMTPQTVNAYYSPTRNEIVFPAGILQPPFFDMAADDAMNYGAIGGVIGHEIGHGFDDQGSKYDGDGNLRSWWTDEDRAAFTALGEKLAAQYDQFEPLEGMHVNGKLSLGENIGDLAGVTIGYKAYRASLQGKEAPVIDGLTGDQRFFMGWAQVWRSKYREDALRAQLVQGPHAPSMYRVAGPIRNVDAFYKAFDVQPGDGMYLPPEERVTIW